MLKVKAEVCIEAKLSSGYGNVNELVLSAAQGHWTTSLLAELFNRHQQQVLDEYLGCKYRYKSQHQFSCTYCRCTSLVRRGTNQRKPKRSNGKLKSGWKYAKKMLIY